MIYRFGLVLALIGSAAAFVPTFADAFGFVKIAPAVVGCLFLWVATNPWDIGKSILDGPLEACAVSFLAALFASIDPRLGLMGVYSQPYHGAVALIPAVLIFYAVRANARRWPDGALQIAALIALIQGIACALQLGGMIEARWATVDGLPGGRALGTMGSPIFLGAILAPCIPPAIWLAARGGALGWACAIAGFLAMAASGSRGPWIASSAGLLAFLAASGRVRARWAALLIVPAVLGVLVASSGALGKLQSDRGRVQVWGIAARAGADRPITGWGPDTFPLIMKRYRTDREIQASAHNDILQAWATTGIAGLLAYGLLWAGVLIGLWRAARGPGDRDRSASVFGSLIAVFVAAKFNPIPPTALYIAAALAGSCDPHAWTEKRPDRRLLWAVALGTLIFAVLFAGLQMASEASHSRGVLAITRDNDIKRGADFLRRANEINPAEGVYASRRCELLFKLAEVYDMNGRREFAKRALWAAGNVVGAHPEDPASYDLMASVQAASSAIIGKHLARDAAQSAKSARELDPFLVEKK